jgi:hypothetical protein
MVEAREEELGADGKLAGDIAVTQITSQAGQDLLDLSKGIV